MQHWSWGGVPAGGCAAETQAVPPPVPPVPVPPLLGGQVIASIIVIVPEAVAPADPM